MQMNFTPFFISFLFSRVPSIKEVSYIGEILIKNSISLFFIGHALHDSDLVPRVLVQPNWSHQIGIIKMGSHPEENH